MLTTVCGIAVALTVTAVHARADEWDKKTVLTVNRTIDVADTVLQPGQYVFRLLDSNSDRHVVQIFNGDQTHLISTVLAIPAYRMNPTSDAQFTFREIPGGSVMALHTWYYPGDNVGQEFPYPKQPVVEETAALLNPPAPPTPQVTTAAAIGDVISATPPIPEPVAAVQPNELPKDGADQQDGADQRPDRAAVSQPEEQPADSMPAKLPKTASPYPLIGLSGLLSLGAYGLLRRKRQSA
jgi:LPXTG-motif cell wall-anchored protein